MPPKSAKVSKFIQNAGGSPRTTRQSTLSFSKPSDAPAEPTVGKGRAVRQSRTQSTKVDDEEDDADNDHKNVETTDNGLLDTSQYPGLDQSEGNDSREASHGTQIKADIEEKVDGHKEGPPKKKRKSESLLKKVQRSSIARKKRKQGSPSEEAQEEPKTRKRRKQEIPEEEAQQQSKVKEERKQDTSLKSPSKTAQHPSYEQSDDWYIQAKKLRAKSFGLGPHVKDLPPVGIELSTLQPIRKPAGEDEDDGSDISDSDDSLEMYKERDDDIVEHIEDRMNGKNIEDSGGSSDSDLDSTDARAKADDKIESHLIDESDETALNSSNIDWKPGAPVPYAALCTAFSLIEMTSKRLVITSLCSDFLQKVLKRTPGDLLPIVQLMIGKLAADYTSIELGIGESLIIKAIGETTGRGEKIVKADQAKIGDLGLVAAKSRSSQSTLLKPPPLTVRKVFDGLTSIATTSGQGSQERKVAGIKKLLSAADGHLSNKGNAGIDITKDKGGASETKFIIRFLEGKLRLGLAEKTVLVALAHATVTHELKKDGLDLLKRHETKYMQAESILKTVYSELPTWEVIIPTMLEHGIFYLREHCKLKPGVPIKPMLAKPTKSITEVLDRFEGKHFTCEYKYDGERAQIHYVADKSTEGYAETVAKPVKSKTGLSAIFSRNSEDLSKKYPDILEKLHTWVKPETQNFVLDCETVAWDLKEKRVLPFQQLMTRKRKDVKIEEVTVKVCVFAFDLLYYNGESLVEKSFRERREILHQAFEEVEGEFAFAQYGDCESTDEIHLLLDESVKASCEGLMVKTLDNEDSHYEPSRRSQKWLKVKKDYLGGIGDSLDLVVIGAYYGKGKRTSVYGAFLLACYNPSTEAYEAITKLGTGLSEALLEEFYNKFQDTIIENPKGLYNHGFNSKELPDVWFEPRVVWEIKAADLTISPRYKAGVDDLGYAKDAKGISLRFPRFVKEREDKKPEDATRSKQVVEMYKDQDQSRDKTANVDDEFEY